MEMRPVFSKEIVGLISLKNAVNSSMQSAYILVRKNREGGFSSPKVSLISILQKFTS